MNFKYGILYGRYPGFVGVVVSMLSKFKTRHVRWFSSLIILLFSPLSAAQSIDWQPGSGIKITPLNPQAGEDVILEVAVSSGASHARGYMVMGFLDGKVAFRERIPLLQAHQQQAIKFRWKAIPGSHEFMFRILGNRTARTDAKPISRSLVVAGTAVTSERAAADVPARQPRRVQVPPVMRPLKATASGQQQPVCESAPLPDLTVSDITISGPGEPDRQHGISLTVSNKGQCASGVFTVKATVRIQSSTIDKVLTIGTRGVGSLQPCRSSTCSEAQQSLSFDFIPQYNHALYNFTVEADPGNVIKEFNEDNNTVVNDLRITVY
jgi:hypothetical protein